MNTRFEEKLTAIPDIPTAFGEDGGHFYRYYDAIADEIDDDMVKSLKAQLDGILIYAGLFAGVNSAFLALTLPEMSADPADDTNALLLQLVTGGNGNITSADDLPSASFSPPSGIFPINILFSLSLTLALLAAFLAVLGQQWLIYYRKRSGGGAEAQRWEQLRRYLGAKRWRLEAILDDILPSLLQLGLVIFCIAFALYLGTLSRWICYIVAIPLGLALTCVLFMAVSAALDQWCPFKSPLSRAVQFVPASVARPFWLIMLHFLSWASIETARAKQIISRSIGPTTKWVGQAASHLRLWSLRIVSRGVELVGKMTRFVAHRVLWKALEPSDASPTLPMENRPRSVDDWVSRVATSLPRPPEPASRLHAIAAKRVLCTSEDTNALTYTAVNLHALNSPEDIQWLLRNADFYKRLRKEWENPCGPFTFVPRGSDPVTLKIGAFYSAFTCLALSSGSAGLLLGPHLGPTPYPPSTDDTEIQQACQHLQAVVWWMNRLAPSLRRPSNSTGPSPQTLCHTLVNIILNPHLERWLLFNQWFKDNAALHDVSAEEASSFAPVAVCLLAYAIHCFTRIQLNLPESSDYDPESEAIRDKEDIIMLSSRNKEYTEWSFHTVCNIIRIYSTWRKRGQSLVYLFFSGKDEWSATVLGLIKESFATFYLNPSTRPSDSIYVSLLKQGWNSIRVASIYMDGNEDAQNFYTAGAIDLSNYFIRRYWQSPLFEPEATQLRNDLIHCFEIIRYTLLWVRQPHLFTETRKLTEFLELVSEGVKKRIDIFDEAIISKILDLEDGLIKIAPTRNEQNQLEEYQTVYNGIKSVINDMGFIRPALSNVTGNPADPPTAQIVEEIPDCVSS